MARLPVAPGWKLHPADRGDWGRLAQLEGFVDKQQEQINGLCRCLEAQQDQLAQLGEFVNVQVQQLGGQAEQQHAHMKELADFSNSLAQYRTESEDRLASLERSAARQAAAASRACEEVAAALRRGYGALQDNHLASCDCLVEAGLLSRTGVRARARERRRLRCLGTVLEQARPVARLCQYTNDGGVEVTRLAAASRMCGGLRRRLACDGLDPAETSPSEPSNDARDALCEVDEETWLRLADHEPTQEVLDDWAASAVVQRVLGRFVLEAVAGDSATGSVGGGTVGLADVWKLFAELGLHLERFVNKFVFASSFRRSRSVWNLQVMAGRILSRFAAQADTKKKYIPVRDLFRILEIAGFPLRRFESVFEHCIADCPLPLLGPFSVTWKIGQGTHSACYAAENVEDGAKVAIKWPMREEEVNALRRMQGRARLSLGLPKVVASGVHEEKHYVVTELLGSPLARLFDRVRTQPSVSRWRLLAVLGRLLVRRLGDLHSCGYVHCDISPENIVLGPPREGSREVRPFAPYLVDYGLARRFPGGPPLARDEGSAEWSSMRSAEGGERFPEDDLEALGWVLLHGFLGQLPWFTCLGWAYKDWDSKWTREQAVRQVRQAKRELLEKGRAPSGAAGDEAVPPELWGFLRACSTGDCGIPARCARAAGGPADAPAGGLLLPRSGAVADCDGAALGDWDPLADPSAAGAPAADQAGGVEAEHRFQYTPLMTLLGGDPSLAPREAEVRDLDQLAALLRPLL